MNSIDGIAWLWEPKHKANNSSALILQRITLHHTRSQPSAYTESTFSLHTKIPSVNLGEESKPSSRFPYLLSLSPNTVPVGPSISMQRTALYHTHSQSSACTESDFSLHTRICPVNLGKSQTTIKSVQKGSYIYTHGVTCWLRYLWVESMHLLSKPPALRSRVRWVRIGCSEGWEGSRASLEERAMDEVGQIR